MLLHIAPWRKEPVDRKHRTSPTNAGIPFERLPNMRDPGRLKRSGMSSKICAKNMF